MPLSAAPTNRALHLKTRPSPVAGSPPPACRQQRGWRTLPACLHQFLVDDAVRDPFVFTSTSIDGPARGRGAICSGIFRRTAFTSGPRVQVHQARGQRRFNGRGVRSGDTLSLLRVQPLLRVTSGGARRGRFRGFPGWGFVRSPRIDLAVTFPDFLPAA
ncbi:hypothetical protein GUJ93_ZPchr0002g24503 [Zizania palustris]|uniref:Uncharacterized protein n=1 Tax=Zizania palustris TaxID=103762 RepID=A0A8J5SJW6_ZIZPA|nr:hypothetical protein GUJ93_ZPchr0002g24503 [Zizania palustris]